MRSSVTAALAAVSFLAASAALAQSPSPAPSPKLGAGATLGAPAPQEVAGTVVTFEVEALAPGLKTPAAAAPEAQAVIGTLKAPKKLMARAWLTQDLSRVEILSADFIMPAGTLVLHRAGDKAYVIADPKAKTYAIMDAEPLLDALEGGAGILHTQYSAKVQNTDEKREIAGVTARKSLVTVSYVASMPLENSRILVQQDNNAVFWHTSGFSSAAALDHIFFKFQRDRTGAVRSALAQDIGFPMEVTMVITQSGAGKKSDTVQPGSLHYLVTSLKKEPALDAGLFRMPPLDYRRVERMPFFAAARPHP
jgi:hypothetical protein